MRNIDEIKEELSVPLTKFSLPRFVESILRHPEDFRFVYELLGSDDPKIAWKATWVCEKIAVTHPGWFSEKADEIISLLLACRYSGVRRLLLNTLRLIELPETFPVSLFDFCLEHMLDMKEPPGVQAVCLKTAYRLCCREPGLFCELHAVMDNTDPTLYSKGFKSAFKTTKTKIEREFSKTR